MTKGGTMGDYRPDFEGQPSSELEEDLDEPRMFKVLLHNDDYTTMEFVVEVLQKVFYKTFAEAMRIMLSVHRSGTGVCGIYTGEVAETKVVTVQYLAKENGFPLQCSMEEA